MMFFTIVATNCNENCGRQYIWWSIKNNQYNEFVIQCDSSRDLFIACILILGKNIDPCLREILAAHMNDYFFYGQCVRTGNYHDLVDTEKLTMELRKKSMVGPKYRSLSDGESLFLRLCNYIFTRLMFL